MTPAQLLCQLKEDAAQGLSKVMSFVQSDDVRNCKDADVQSLLSALSELSTKARSSIVLEQVADILSTLATLRHFSEQELKAWLAAATSVVTKDATQSTSIARILDAAASYLSYKEEKLAPVMVSWCRLALQVLLNDNENLRAVAGSLLQNNRDSILGRRKLAAHAHTAVRNHLVTPLRKWFDRNKGADALKVWSIVVNWLGETLRKSQAACINALLSIVEKGFRSSSTEIQCLTLETWKVLIDNIAIDPETLKLTRSLKLLMTPLKGQLSHKVQVQLQGVRTNWYLARQLGEALPDAFEQVCSPLLQNVAVYLSEGRGPGTPEDKRELKRECVYMLARLLEPSSEAHVPMSATTLAVDIPLAALPSPLPMTILSRQIAAFEKASGAAFAWMHTQHDIEGVDLLIGRWLIHRALEAHNSKNVQVVSSILKLTIDAMGKHLLPAASMRIIQEACSMPETLLLSHCYYSGKSGVLHGTPAFSLLELLFQPGIIKAFGSQEEFITQVQQLLAVGMKGSSWLHFAQGAVNLLEQTPPEVAPLGSLWLALASPLLTCIQSTQEVNQGNQLEHDFSALVAILCFPIHHVFAVSGLQDIQNKRTIQKKWAELYRAFACCAGLVPTASPNTSCHEFCRRLCAGLMPQLKEEITYVELICDVLVTVDNYTGKSVLSRTQSGAGVSPKWGAHTRHRNSTLLGNLHWYVLTLAWCLDGCSLAEKRLRDNRTAQHNQEKNVLLGVLQTCLRLAQELFQCLSSSSLLEETLKLLGPSLAPFFAVTKGKFASKGFTSSITPKLEALWSALVTSTVTNYLGPRDGSLLPALASLLEATLLHPRATINDRAVQLWHALFAQTSTPLDIPASLKEVLQKMRPCLLPGFVPVDDLASSCQAASSSQDDFFVPDAKLPVLPKNERATTMPPPALSASHLAAPKQAKRRLEEMKDEEFVRIDSPLSKPAVLTEHQKEVLRERRPLPALYNNLSQDVADSTCSETQDPVMMDAHEESPEVAKSELEALQEVIVVDSEDEDQTTVDGKEVVNGVPIEAEEIVGPSQSPEEMPRAVSPIARVVPETQDLLLLPLDPPLVMSDVQVVLKKIDSSQIANLKVAYPQSLNDSGSCSPRVHKPKRKLSFAQKSSVSFEEAADAVYFNSDDIVPCSQSADEDGVLSACCASQSGSDTGNSILKDSAMEGMGDQWKSEKKALRKRNEEPAKNKRKRKSLKHQNSNGITTDSHQAFEPSARKADDDTLVPRETACEAVSYTTNQSKQNMEHEGAHEKVEKGQESSEELRQGTIFKEGTKHEAKEDTQIKAAEVDDKMPSNHCDDRADATNFGVKDDTPPKPNVEREAAVVKKRRRGRPKNVSRNVLQDNGANSNLDNINRAEQSCKESSSLGSKPGELNHSGTENSSVGGSKPAVCGNEKGVEGVKGDDQENGSSQESSCTSQDSSGSTQGSKRPPRRRKKSLGMLAAEEPDKLIKRAKLGCPSDFGTKNIKSYFFSVTEEQSKVEGANWDGLLNVEELQPEDGVSPLPRDNEVLVSSEASIKRIGKTYHKSSGGPYCSEKTFDTLVSKANEKKKLSGNMVVTDTEQTQPYDFLEREGKCVDFEDDQDKKVSEACPVVKETEDTELCESPQLVKIHTFTSEHPNDPAAIESQISTEKIEEEHEESSYYHPAEATEISNTNQDRNRTESFECTSEALLTSKGSYPHETTSEIKDACQQDSVCEHVLTGPRKEIETVGLNGGVSNNEDCMPDPVGHAEHTSSSAVELGQQMENSFEVDEGNDVHSGLPEAKQCEETKLQMNRNTSEEGITIEECLAVEGTDCHLHSITTDTTAKASPCKKSSGCPEEESANLLNEVKINGNGLAHTDTEGENEVVTVREAACSLAKISGAKKRKLPFQMISPIANRLRSRQLRRSLDSSQPFAQARLLEESPAMWSMSSSNNIQVTADPMDHCTSPTKRPSQPGVTGAPCMSPLSRSQKMLDAAIKRAAELSPSSKAKIILDEPTKDGEPRGFVGILKKHTSSNRNGDAFSPKQSRRHVSFADPIVQGACKAHRVPLRRRRSLDTFYVPKEEDLAEEAITDSQEPVCKELETCTDSVEKVIPFITTGTWASSIKQYLERLGLDTVGALGALRPPQVQLMPLKAPKVSTLRRGLYAYLASLPSSPTFPAEELATAALPEETNTQDQEPRGAEVSGEEQQVFPLPCNGASGMQDAAVQDSKDSAAEGKSPESNSESRKEASVDCSALSKVLDQLTPEVLSVLPYAKVVNLLNNVVQVIRMHVPPEQNVV